MDPNQTWRDLADAVARDDWEMAAECAENLVEWLGKGAVPPAVTGRLEFDRLVVLATANAVAAWEIA